MMLREGTTDLPDGRTVAWATWGDPEGRPLMVAHGTPGSRLDRNVPSDSIERMAAELDVAGFEIIPGAGHLGWIAHEERIFGALL